MMTLALTHHWEAAALPALFVVYTLNWIVGFALQISIIRKLRERLPEEGYTINPFKNSPEISWKFIKFIFLRRYKKLNDPGLNRQCSAYRVTLLSALMLMALFPVAIILGFASHSGSSPTSDPSLTMHPLDFTHEVRIKATSNRVWNALVNPETVAKYHLAPLHCLELKNDGAIVYGTEAKPLIAGRIIDFQAGRKLVHSFRFDPISQPATASDPETVVTYEIQSEREEAVLKLSQTGFTEENQTRANINGGWPYILERLKTTLEEQ